MRTTISPNEMTNERNVSFLFVSNASCLFPAPKSPPTIIDIAEPKAMMDTINTFEIVDVMFAAATTSRPLIA